MTYTTLQYSGLEKPLADWGIATCIREASNQAHDHVACDMMLPTDADDPIPFGSQIILRIGRVPSGGAGATSPTTGLPLSGLTSFTGGQVFFVGWRVETFRTGSGRAEQLSFKFAGPWEFFFERLVFQKLWFTWNGTANVADWRSQVVLGQSVNALVGPNDTVPGSNATNLMSIRQQVAEIIGYVVNQTVADYGAAQIQSDGLTYATDGTNYDLYATMGANLLIPDYIPGYAVSGKTSAQTGTSAANMQTVLRAPLEAVNDITCAEALRKQLRWIGPMGDAVVWFDYTTTLSGAVCPTLKITTRDVAPSISVPFVGSVSAVRIKKRDDLTPGCVALKFRVSGTWNSVAYAQVVNDIAGTVSGTVYEGIGLTGALYSAGTFATGSPALLSSGTMTALQNAARDFTAVAATIDMEGNSNNLARCSIKTMAVNVADPSTGGGASFPFWKKVFPEFNTLTAAPSLFSGSTVTATIDDPGGADDGTAVNLTTFAYLLTDGQIAPWMLAGNAPGGAGAQVVQATINAKWVIAENTVVNGSNLPLNQKAYVEKTARVTLASIPGGLYQVQASFTPGEVIPYGLAGYIYNIAKIPQYEGSLTIQETEVSDICPMGQNLNITGGRTEWTTMNACVVSVLYDLLAARTTLTVGPAPHLGAKDMVERLRANRGPRNYYFIGSNITNDPGQQAGTQLGNSVTQRGPSPGTAHHQVMHFNNPGGLADIQAHTYSDGNPGGTIDLSTSGQPNYGGNSGLSAPNKPTIFFSEGSGGALGKWFRISTADLPSGGQAYFQPCQVCISVSGTPTWVSAYILAYIPTS